MLFREAERAKELSARPQVERFPRNPVHLTTSQPPSRMNEPTVLFSQWGRNPYLKQSFLCLQMAHAPNIMDLLLDSSGFCLQRMLTSDPDKCASTQHVLKRDMPPIWWNGCCGMDWTDPDEDIPQGPWQGAMTLFICLNEGRFPGVPSDCFTLTMGGGGGG